MRNQHIYEQAYRKGVHSFLIAKAMRREPNLPTLDSKVSFNEVEHSTIYHKSVDISDIIGTQTTSRKTSFANNFMPIVKSKEGDFVNKWIKVYENMHYWLNSNNAIFVREYMHDYFVVEGNKRISVSKFAGFVKLGVSIERLIPKIVSKETEAYHEGLSIERRYGIDIFKFSEPKSYKELEERLKQYDNEELKNLQKIYSVFSEMKLKKVKTREDKSILLLEYLKKFGPKRQDAQDIRDNFRKHLKIK